jgi:hypothetical protein
MMKGIGIKTALSVAVFVTTGFVFNVTAKAMPPQSTSDIRSKVSFGAFYTKVNSGQPFETYSRTGKYADIVVQVSHAGGRLVFWRGASYLPYWETSSKDYVPEVIFRKGDGTGMMPDRVNTFSHVRIIENSPEQVIVHWRYEADFEGGNPKTKVETEDFVDEYFTIKPDGRVVRTIKKCTAHIDDWHDPLNKTTQTFTLTAAGIIDLSTKGPAVSSRPDKISGNPIQGPVVGAPVAWWKFDEGAGLTATESVNELRTTILGHKGLWKEGVSGTALQFDGYFSQVSLPSSASPIIDHALTLEAWVAIGAYPWNWAPLVQQGDDEGYFLGIDGHGYPGFRVRAGDQWLTLDLSGDPPYSDNLKCYRWYHLAGTYDKAAGKMCLYINGRLAGEKSVAHSEVQTTQDPIQIGKGKDRIPVDNYKKNSTSYAFDGLIDEVRIYDVALGPDRVAQSYANFNPGSMVVDNPDMQPRLFPTEDTDGRFDARYVTLSYHEAWDNVFRVSDHADIVVGFDELPTRFVFWRGMTYIPHMVNEKGQWYTNEFNETWDNAGQEPMADQLSQYNHVRIIERTPARIVVHWRYPLINTQKIIARYDSDTGWGEWSDWYWTIYPDGIAAKRMRCWHTFKGSHEWHTGWPTLPPNQRPEDVVETDPFLTLIDLDGQVFNHPWDRTVRVDFSKGRNIHVVHLTGRYDPVDISDNTGGNAHYGDGGVQPWFSDFPAWNHWPISLSESVGRPAHFPDRAIHSSLVRANPQTYARETGPAPWEEKVMLEGMTDLKSGALVTLARSWLKSPQLTHVTGATSQGYERSERAYKLTAMAPTLSFQIEASDINPIYNPAFVIKNWHSPTAQAALKIDGVPCKPGPDFRQGVIIDTDGTYTLVIWLDDQATSTRTFEIKDQTADRGAPASSE